MQVANIKAKIWQRWLHSYPAKGEKKLEKHVLPKGGKLHEYKNVKVFVASNEVSTKATRQRQLASCEKGADRHNL